MTEVDTDTSTAAGATTAPTAADALRRAKVEELQRKRAASASAQGRTSAPVATDQAVAGRVAGRKGVATGSKIAAAGFAMATMLGLVGAMGLAQKNSASTGTPQVIPPAQVVVVIHPATTVATSGAAPGSAAATPAVVAAAPNQPIVLSAQPVVRQAPASQAPAAKTSGSK